MVFLHFPAMSLSNEVKYTHFGIAGRLGALSDAGQRESVEYKTLSSSRDTHQQILATVWDAKDVIPERLLPF